MSDSTVKKYNQYFSSRPRISITMTDGRRIAFVGGQYVTDNADEIAFLDEQIRAKHQMIFVKPDHLQVTQEQLDPLASVKKKAVEEYLKQQAEQQDPTRNFGKTTQDMVMQTSQSIATISAGSKSGK
jgi:hypothetical protein